MGQTGPVFDSLDFLYMPSRDVAADLAFYTEILGGEALFAIEAFGARVAEVRLATSGPRLLLADHLEGEAAVLVHRVADLGAALDRLGRGRRTGRRALRHPARPMRRTAHARGPAAGALRAHPPGCGRAPGRPVRLRRARMTGPSPRIVCIAVICAVVGVAGCASGTAPATSSGCRARVIVGVLPAWARGGFSDAKPRMPYVLGRAGRIAAILWADPLLSPAARDHSNKILWVSRDPAVPGSDLRISAQRMTGPDPIGPPVRRRVMGSPGPSIIDLPRAGCWHLTLRWSGRLDTLDLRYASNS